MVRENGSCIYVQGPYEGDTDQYWIRSLPLGYSAGPMGIVSPAGTVLVHGQSVTVSGTVSDVLGDTVCVSIHTLDATSIR
jgi:alanine racemase